MKQKNTMTLFHGSPVVVREPSLLKGRPDNDYGRGFYCTEDLSLAKEWACTEADDGWANQYELAAKGLRILRLSSPAYSVLHWMALLVRYRNIRLHAPVMRSAAQWLLENYEIDLAPWDVVIGWRADDSYFSFARSFLANTITVGQLERAMKLGKLGEQVVLRSEAAFAALKFVSAESAASVEWYPRRRRRDMDARAAFEQDEARGDPGGETIRDLMEGHIR